MFHLLHLFHLWFGYVCLAVSVSVTAQLNSFYENYPQRKPPTVQLRDKQNIPVMLRRQTLPVRGRYIQSRLRTPLSKHTAVTDTAATAQPQRTPLQVK